MNSVWYAALICERCGKDVAATSNGVCAMCRESESPNYAIAFAEAQIEITRLREELQTYEEIARAYDAQAAVIQMQEEELTRLREEKEQMLAGWDAQLDRLADEMTDLRQLLTEARDALQALVTHTSSGFHGGDMQQMATLEGRLKWYDGLMPIRDKARALLARLEAK